ncbi:MaoC/PaaZ C-terminal domain-containing protein [Nocardiopsis sp. JB363]|uniref:MaoC/PaaZ C-terminal domain-containing protein n=1 Tax=Nocardiopsis sp. JB363 TaxID=1434837 RepID=UPI00097B3555|nr:MaoC/PaaZ C-terminal domain-containing protein [Nocardiopsis sp. JB363]SIO90782.1 MaoC family protein [Nocardiopsis sp. JB363]
MITTPLQVGDQLPPLEIAPISRTTLALFAGGSGDHNPVHIDLDAAHTAGMDDVFAHGMLGMAYLGRMLTAWVPQDRLRTLHVRFTAITPVHAAPVCSGMVAEVHEQHGELRATIQVTVQLADGTTTLSGHATVAAYPPMKGM